MCDQWWKTHGLHVRSIGDALKDLEEPRARSATQFKDLAKDVDVEKLEAILEDLYEPEGHHPGPVLADEDNQSDGYAANEAFDDTVEMPGIVNLMLCDLRDERERTPRRRRDGDASTEPPQTLEHPPQPQFHLPPQRDDVAEGSPSKKARTEEDTKPEEISIPDEADGDEMVVEDVMFIDTSNSSLPEGWIVVDNQF